MTTQTDKPTRSYRVKPDAALSLDGQTYTSGDTLELDENIAFKLESVQPALGRYILCATVFEQPMNTAQVQAAAMEGRTIPPVFKSRRRGAILTFDEAVDGPMVDRLLGIGAIETVEDRAVREAHQAKVADLDAERARLEGDKQDAADQAKARRVYETAREVVRVVVELRRRSRSVDGQTVTGSAISCRSWFFGAATRA